jgi:hypothetical protein
MAPGETILPVKLASLFWCIEVNGFWEAIDLLGWLVGF